MPGTQIGFHRTNDKTIQFFGQQDIVQQGDTSPLGLNALVTVEGLDNFRESYTTGLGVVVSRRVGQGVALYAHPIWVANGQSCSRSTSRTRWERRSDSLRAEVRRNDNWFIGFNISQKFF